MDGAWDQMYSVSMFTDTSGDQIMFLPGTDFQQTATPSNLVKEVLSMMINVLNILEEALFWEVPNDIS